MDEKRKDGLEEKVNIEEREMPVKGERKEVKAKELRKERKGED